MAASPPISVTDTQIHIWGAETPERPWLEGHQDPHQPVPFSAADAVAAMDDAGVARAVIIPPSWEGDRNDLALQAVADYPGRFAIMGRIDVDVPGSADLAHWTDTPGMLGIRLARRGMLEHGLADWVWPIAERAALPVMIYGPRQNDMLAKIADDYPGLPLIIDHLNLGTDFAPDEIAPAIESLLVLADRPNVAVKVSGFPARLDEPYPFPGFHPHLRRVVAAFGAERCMWGSDVTTLPCTYTDWIRAITEAADYLSDSEKALLMGGSASKWLNWPLPS